MTLEEILKDVELRGKDESEKIIEYYEEQFNQLKKKHEQQIKALTEEYAKKFEDEKRTVERSIISSAEMEGFKVIRTKKSDLIDDAVGRAEMYLLNLVNKKNEYSKILNKMVEIATKTLGQDCVISISKKDYALIKNRTKLHFTHPKEDIGGGIIARSKDGSMELDLSFRSVFANIVDSISSRVSEHIGD
jgi:vacuolar-type H+-ATPase subunit E/Vma4